MVNLVRIIFEVAVLGSLALGIASKAAVIGTCDMLVLGRSMSKIGPWRADISARYWISNRPPTLEPR